MKICVAGLGLIGGSICMALKRAGYFVAGYNRTKSALDYALKNNIIDEAAEKFEEYDVVFIALPPEITLNFLKNGNFKKSAFIYDICGVKSFLEDWVIENKPRFNYVGCHPMAGKEVTSISNSCAHLFDGASMIITVNDNTDAAALSTLKRLTKDMGFGLIVECDACLHDKKIGYTSQLAHILSNAYAANPELEASYGFTGGSFEDMTRIACVDERAWADLYLANSQNVVASLDFTIQSLQKIRDAIASGDKEKLCGELSIGRLNYAGFKNNLNNSHIKIEILK